MKFIRRFLFAAVICAALQPVHAQVSNPDSMVRKVFATLQAKDKQAFVALYPNADQLGRFIRGLMEKTFQSEEMRKMMAMDEKTKFLNIDSLVNAQIATATSAEAFTEMQKQFGDIYQRIIDKGEKKGVNWSGARLTSYTIDSTESQDEDPLSQPVKVKTIKGIIEFTSAGQPYQLAFDKMIYLPAENSWFGADFPQLARKGESLAPDAAADAPEAGKAPASPNKQKQPAKKNAPVKKSGTTAPVKKKTTA